jgi:hypothetical protein
VNFPCDTVIPTKHGRDWSKSSMELSDDHGGHDHSSDDAPRNWVKSSRSMANGNCVQVAGLPGDLIHVRDSQNPAGPVLRFEATEWGTFVGGVRKGEFDRR